MLTAYLIDPTAATICKVRLNPSNVGAALRHHIGCKLLDRVWIDDRHFVHLDEEALLAPVTGLWYVPHSSPQPYAGRAVILAEARNGAVEEPLRPIEHFASAIRVARPVRISVHRHRARARRRYGRQRHHRRPPPASSSSSKTCRFPSCKADDLRRSRTYQYNV
ncbi:hypothetical protein IY145_23925 [Methylosinus sp. H3A]|uniref:hypothetical protein n=1 Tax=Methylosinus sp. H3A TaxID=2785786 RepID=UPI0018C273F0|nr:hypothetical protein [Methylosinus sp. H3A]MBG0812395.1 hypothetical protein [Methylosinus sp. H3A]